MSNAPSSIIDADRARFQSKVDTSGGPDACWPWTAFTGDTGYGQFWDGTRLVKAHRHAYLIANGQEPAGDADHTCHNDSGCTGGPTCAHRACCNPRHLEDVPHVENVRRGEAGKQRMAWKTSCIHGHLHRPHGSSAMPQVRGQPIRKPTEQEVSIMAGEISITVVGNLTSDPELRYTQNGLAVANFTIASTPKVWDKQSNAMKDDAGEGES